MDAAPKTKGHVKALMHRLYEKAMLWEIVEWQRNPMQLVEIKGISKRKKRPVVLTVEQYYLILALIPQPYRTMVMVAQCTGLRAEEVLARMGRHRFREAQHEGRPGRRSRPRQDSEDGVFRGRASA
jgi:integrase